MKLILFESMKLDLSKYYVVLVYPKIHINTAEAYSGVKPKMPNRSLEEDILTLPVEQWKENIHNDFEDSIFPQFPEIKNIKEKLYSNGAIYAAMSGSGSTVFGVFEKETDLKSEFGDAFVFEGKL